LTPWRCTRSRSATSSSRRLYVCLLQTIISAIASKTETLPPTPDRRTSCPSASMTGRVARRGTSAHPSQGTRGCSSVVDALLPLLHMVSCSHAVQNDNAQDLGSGWSPQYHHHHHHQQRSLRCLCLCPSSRVCACACACRPVNLSRMPECLSVCMSLSSSLHPLCSTTAHRPRLSC
jgi:hypothetical protein